MTWEFVGYNMLIFYSALRVVPRSLYEAAEIDGAGQWRIITVDQAPRASAARWSSRRSSRSSAASSSSTSRASCRPLAPNAITTYFTPNFYTYSLSFNGQQHNYSATVAIIMGVITMIVAYVVQLRGMRKEA